MSFIRVEVKNKMQFIKIDDFKEVTCMNLAIKVVKEFKLTEVQGTNVIIFDNLDTRIKNDEELRFVLEHFYKSSTFFIKLQFVDTNKDVSLITSDVMKDILINNGGGAIIKTYDEEGTINETLRRKLINIVNDFIEKTHTLWPTHDIKMAVSEALITLFPVFRSETSKHKGVDLFYNPSDVNNPGWLVTNLKHRRKVHKKNLTNEQNESSVQNEATKVNYNDDMARKDSELLKTLVVNCSGDDRAKVHNLLTKTLKYRRELSKSDDVNLLQEFPYYFTRPDLILHDFGIAFDVDPDGFKGKWELYKSSIKKVLKLHKNPSEFSTVFGGDIELMLILLYLIPQKQCGRKTIKECSTFSESVRKLVVFSKVGEPPLAALVQTNKQPYILAHGVTAKDIYCYFIAIDGEIINVPWNSFGDAFDLLFKLYHLLNLNYDKMIEPLMNFIAHFFYKIDVSSFKPTGHMKRVFNDISKSM